MSSEDQEKIEKASEQAMISSILCLGHLVEDVKTTLPSKRS